MDQKTARTLEKEIEKSVVDVIFHLGLGKLATIIQMIPARRQQYANRQ